MTDIKRYRVQLTRLVLVIVALLAVSPDRIAHAQEAPPDLVVTIRDAEGAGVPQVRVLVRDGSGTATLAQETTDAAGVARFPTVPLSEIRVAVSGTTLAGVPLTQTGDDARGVPLLLLFGPATLDLRVEPSGLVLPDPTRMIAPDPGAALGTVELPRDQPLVIATAPALAVGQTPVALIVDTPAPLENETSPLEPIETPASVAEEPITLLIAAIVMALIAVGVVGVAVLRAQGRSRR
jgi:hypothetical protein